MFKFRLCVLSLFVASASCGPICDIGIGGDSCSKPKKKGDLRLNNKTSWTIIDQTGIDWELSEYGPVSIAPDASARFKDTAIPEGDELVFIATYQPPSDMDTSNIDVFYTIPMIPDTLTDVDLNGEKAYGDWITPFGDNISVSYPELPPPPTNGSGGGSDCAGASSGPCAGYANQCAQCGSMACQAPCYCAAACVCRYCGDTSCEQSNRSTASSLGTSCSY